MHSRIEGFLDSLYIGVRFNGSDSRRLARFGLPLPLLRRGVLRFALDFDLQADAALHTGAHLFFQTLLAFLAVGAVGCGDDDDDNPTDPIGGNFDDFDQTTAVAQSQVAAPQGVSLVESIQGMALGVGNKDYAYNENRFRVLQQMQPEAAAIFSAPPILCTRQ